MTYEVVHDCKRPSIVNMDHMLGWHPDIRPIVNRICLTCYTHWYGDAEMAVFEMPRKTWDGWVER